MAHAIFIGKVVANAKHPTTTSSPDLDSANPTSISALEGAMLQMTKNMNWIMDNMVCHGDPDNSNHYIPNRLGLTVLMVWIFI